MEYQMPEIEELGSATDLVQGHMDSFTLDSEPAGRKNPFAIPELDE